MYKTYKNNIEITDTYLINHKKINKGLLYDGDYNLIVSQVSSDDKKIQPLAAAVLGLNNTGIPLPNDLEFYDTWTDNDAQEAYLKVKPKCYLILGKQGLGSYSIGEALSKKLNCVHLCPRNIITDEIDQKSSTGKCLDFAMRHNKVCQFNIIMSILERKLLSAAIKHRGFIISGFPLITSNRHKEYKIKTLNSEEALCFADEFLYDVIYNLKRKKQKGKNASWHSSVTSDLPAEEEEIEEEQERVNEEGEEEKEEHVELPKFLLDSCSNLVFSTKTKYQTLKSVILMQVQKLLNLQPDILIYLSTPDKDTITKRSRKYINYMTSTKTFNAFAINSEHELRWPTQYDVSDYNKPIETHNFNPKYNCKQPIHFNEVIINQICNYKDHICSFLEEKFNEFDPKLVIKLDGRMPIHQLIHHILERILMLPIKPVLVPEPLYLDEPPDDNEEFWRSVEELNVIRSGNINFNRYASAWFNRCPVELKKRRTVQGNPKYAVTFFKHVYLLSSLENMISFCRNPRPYLKLKYLEPTCRVIIIGTKSSGKTLVANCLSWIFDTPIFCYKQFLNQQRQNKYADYSKTIFSEIIATIEDKRLAQWESAESERVSQLNDWYTNTASILSSYIHLFKKKMAQVEGEPDINLLNKYYSIRNQLLFLPIIDNLELCRDALKNKNLLNYAPENLLKEASKPVVPVLDDNDVTEGISAYITANSLQNEIEPTIEELMTELIKIIQDLDSKSITSAGTYGNYILDGFSSNPEYWEYLIEHKLLPDYTIAIHENREIDSEIFQYYEDIEKSTKNYHERYMQATDVIIKTKLLHKKPVETSLLDIRIILDEIVNNILSINPSETDKNEAELIKLFTEDIEKFREDWDMVKLKLDENSKSFIEVEVEDKSDIQIIEEILLKIRKSYCKPCVLNEIEGEDNEDIDNVASNNLLIYNDSRKLNETNVYCPIAYYDYGVLWEGKSEFSLKYDNKNYYFAKEECSEKFQRDITKYQFFNSPIKDIPAIRICVIGGTGSGKTSAAKKLARELGLLHVDFAEYINNVILPRHYRKVGWQYENSFTDPNIDEETTEFQMDEENVNLVSDILANEQELRRMLYNYFEHGVPLISVLMQKIIYKLWFENPFQHTGIVIDGYPKLPTDVEDMMTCFCIPDAVIELECNSETTLARLSSKYFKIWKTQLNDAKHKVAIKLQKDRNEWMDFIVMKVVIKLVIDDLLADVIPDFVEPSQNVSAQSTIIDAYPSGSANVDVNLFATYNEIIQEYPEPVDQNEWENADDVLERINARLESIFETDDENIQTLKDTLSDQKVKTISIDGKKSSDKVFRKILLKLSYLRSRCESYLEQTYIINYDIAEILLLEGFFLLSKFNRMCPVFIYENPHAISNLYNISKLRNKLFPVIHRAYIYFLSSEGSVVKFRTNPLKYVKCDFIKEYKPYPLRISVIGGPKSGKSKLAAKLAKRYGLMCISRGIALRYVLENLHWAEIGLKLNSNLQSGEYVDNECIMKAVSAILMDHRTMTNGFILDGFPETPYEATMLLKGGLFPVIIIDLDSDLETTILKNSQSEIYYDILKTKPSYPVPFIKYRYSNWYRTSQIIRDWIHYDTQNLYLVNGNNSKWQCYLDSHKIIDMIIPKIHDYLINAKENIVSVDIFGICNDDFHERMSIYKNVCPVCLRKNIIRHNGFPPDKKGLVQYNDKFYWICPEHFNYVYNHPEILDFENIKIPELPAVIKHVNPSLVFENGICLVTYAENMPCQKIITGKNEFAASYKGKTYLFCSGKCLNKFLEKPYMYYDITVFKEMQVFPKLSLNQLPHIGYLEQTLANIITDACCAVNVARPKYPGLDAKVSALIHIALYLKTHNPRLNKPVVELYKKAFKLFEIRSKLIIEVGLRLRSMDNPFNVYPKCCVKESIDKLGHETKKLASVVSPRISTDSEISKIADCN